MTFVLCYDSLLMYFKKSLSTKTSDFVCLVLSEQKQNGLTNTSKECGGSKQAYIRDYEVSLG